MVVQVGAGGRCHHVLHGFFATRLLPVLPEFPDAVETRLRALRVVLVDRAGGLVVGEVFAVNTHQTPPENDFVVMESTTAPKIDAGSSTRRG